MKVHDVMSAIAITATPDHTFPDLCRAILKKNVNAMPVIDKKKKLVGIVTKDDLLSVLYPDYQDLMGDFSLINDLEALEDKVKEKSHIKAKDIMNTTVIFTRVHTPIMRALSRMIVRRVNQLPVLSETDEVVGMITKGDVFKHLFRKKKNTPGAAK